MQLDAGFSDDVAGTVVLPLWLVEHVLADFAHIANQVREESVAGIEPAVHGDGVEFGQLIAVRFDEGKFVGRNVFFEIDGRILRHANEVADFLPHRVFGHVQALRDEWRVGGEVAGGVAHHQHGGGRIVIDDEAAFAVDNLAARREQRNFADAVVFGLRDVVIAVRNLQAPEAVAEHEENGEDGVLHRRQPHRRYFFFPAQHVLLIPLLKPIEQRK